MLKKIAVAALVLIAILLTVVALQPDTFRIVRMTTIQAPPDAVFRHINDLRAWQGWSPWEGLDPELKRTYEGPHQGVGAKYSWEGNDKVGKGSMKIIESKDPERIAIDLAFLEPMEARNETVFTLSPVEDGHTRIVWSMAGRNSFFGKAFSLFFDMDALVGADFEKGLAALKRVSEVKTEGVGKVASAAVPAVAPVAATAPTEAAQDPAQETEASQ